VTLLAAAGAALAGLAAALAIRGPGDGRLRSVLGRRGEDRGTSRHSSPATRARWAAGLAGVGAWAVLGGAAGVGVGAVVAVVAHRALVAAAGRAPAASAALVADAPLAFDLLAACISAGAAPEAAITSVADAVGGQLGRLLGAVAQAASLGCPAEQAWAPLLEPAIPAPLREGAAGFVRAQRSGAALAPVLGTIAAAGRRARQVAAQAAARRAGVLAVGPLGLCFLPAFVLVGVVPLVAGLVGAVTW
jgi:pilus assembly protein TadC